MRNVRGHVGTEEGRQAVTQTRKILAVLVAVLMAISAMAWVTGQSSAETIRMLAIGFLLIAAFYFALTLLIRLPFQRLRGALASLFSIVFVLLGVLYVVPLIEQYRRGYDVSHSLLHPLVFGALGIGIYLLTERR